MRLRLWGQIFLSAILLFICQSKPQHSDWFFYFLFNSSLPIVDFSSIDHIDDPEEYFSAFDQLESNPLYSELASFIIKRSCN